MIRNRPKGDIWKLEDTEAESQHYGRIYKFDFSFIFSNEIKDVVMDYIWGKYRIGDVATRSLSALISAFAYFNAFANERGIIRFKDMTNNDVDNLLSYLRTTISEHSKRPLAYRYQKMCFGVLRNVVHWGQIHKPNEVPDKEIFTGNEYSGINRKLKIDYIPDNILAVINESLKNEGNPYVRYGTIILESTGMRIGDLLLLRVDCIEPHPIDGHTIQWLDHKKRKERPTLPIKRECVLAVERLLECTKETREEADNSLNKYLFIHKAKAGMKNGQVVKIHETTLRTWFKNFIKINNIVGSDGELYNLTFHQFRRTLGTDMLSKGINVNVIQQVLGHAFPYTTNLYYTDIKDRERAEIFKGVGIIGNIAMLDASVFDNKKEMEWFDANKDKGACMSDGYCTKPFAEGKVCDRLLKRQKCYTCSRYITTPEYLDAHKNHLYSLERQIAENAIYGEHYAEHFRPTIGVLKVIIERLEAL